MNKVILVGNLAKDPEINSTASGISVCNMTLAVNRDYVNNEGERECDFFPVKVWRGRAENCAKYLNKGSKIAVVGTLQNRSYEDKDGNVRYITEIVASDVEFLSNKIAEGVAPAEDAEGEDDCTVKTKKTGTKKTKTSKSKSVKMTPVEDDKLPF